MTFDRFPEEGTTRDVPELLSMDLPRGERVYTHRQIATTLGERGHQLPLGVGALVDTGDVAPGFELAPATVREQVNASRKVRGAVAARKPMGYQHATLIGAYLHALGETDFTNKRDGEKLALVSQLPLGDVAYLIYAIESLLDDGERELAGVVYNCSACAFRVEQPEVDLGSRPVGVFHYQAGSPPRAVLGLRKPFKMGNREVSKLVLAPVSFQTAHLNAESNVYGSNAPELQQKLIAGAIRGTQDEHPMPPVAPAMLNGMHAKDLDVAAHVVSALSCEPAPILVHECPSCGESNNLLRSWVDPGFFGGFKS